MSQQQRNQNLYGVQDWKNMYQTFRDADFKSYDYETLRKSMVDFLRLYNPENFNDYINSSEYVSLIDLISFMGQSLSFRMDLNARENFLETAQRRDSILRLSNLVNYVPKRNSAATGALRIETLRTDETIVDSMGRALTNVSITWNDRSNSNWQEQWNTILNAAFTSSQQVGRPGNSTTIDGILTSLYTVDLPAGQSAPFKYNATVNNTLMPFEVINPKINQGALTEYGSNIRTIFNLLYRDDQMGYSSNNTGFFLNFKQGTLLSERFSVTESLPNRQVYLASSGINNNDVWLYQVGSTNALTAWTKLDSVSGSTLSYNTASSTIKTVYSLTSRAEDGVTLVFGDGVFGEIPVGNFVTYYRVSNGLSYRITPAEMTNVIINIPYLSKSGRTQILTVTASLKYTVANSAARETLDDIKLKAPQNYYTQNRMVNGQDYNSFPYVKYNNIVKIKSVNRTSSGVSRYLDVIDPTGRFSSTNIVGDDGYLYTDTTNQTSSFTFTTRDDVVEKVNNLVLPAIADASMLAFFYQNYSAQNISSTVIKWNLVLADNDVSSGYITNNTNTLLTTENAVFTASNVNRFRVGAVLKFAAPSGKIFNYDNRLVTAGATVLMNQRPYIYATVTSVSYQGRGNQTGNANAGRDLDGTGAIVLSEKIPTGALLTAVLPTFTPVLPADIQTQLVTALVAQQSVGLKYVAGSSNTDSVGTWFVSTENPVTGSSFSEPRYDTSVNGTNKWLLAFNYVSNTYTVTQRSVRYYYGSERQTRFFYDPRVKIYDPASGKLLKDQIDVLKPNTLPNQSGSPFSNDITMSVYNSVIESDGYLDDTKVQVTFADKNSNGSPDTPYFYTDIVGTPGDALPNAGNVNSYVFFFNNQNNGGSQLSVLKQGVVKLVNNVGEIDSNLYTYTHGDIVFTLDAKAFYKITRNGDTASRATVTGYSYRMGRQKIKYQYRHNAPADRRIDPSPSNIIDIYVLEKNYADDYILWIRDYTGTVTQPTEPTTESLRNDFADLENYRMISDLIIYSSATFKPLFGSKADANLQCQFVVVKNANVGVSDSEVRSQVVSKINDYFSVDNWDFGETFYFSDLASYLHAELSTIISSVHLVPTSTGQVYGDLQQIRCQPDEILTSAATVLDINVVTNLTNTVLRVGN